MHESREMPRTDGCERRRHEACLRGAWPVGEGFRFVLQVMAGVQTEGHFLIRFEAKLLVFRPPPSILKGFFSRFLVLHPFYIYTLILFDFFFLVMDKSKACL